jgi:hypothetical protein
MSVQAPVTSYTMPAKYMASCSSHAGC